MNHIDQEKLVKSIQSIHSALIFNHYNCAETTNEFKESFCQLGFDLSVLLQKMRVLHRQIYGYDPLDKQTQ